MKSGEERREYRGLSVTELTQKVRDFEEESMRLRFRQASTTGDPRSTTRRKVLRKGIARAKTIIREQMAASSPE